MRVGIMQPYFAPALGYFDLISLCDQWVVFDTAQFRNKSWMSRNRILHPTSGWQYITAHVKKHSRDTRIADVELSDEAGWRDRLIARLGHYKKRAPHYPQTAALLRGALDSEQRSLARLSVELLRRVCALLDIEFAPRYFSEMDLALGPIDGPGDWALRISQALGASEYVNPPGGEHLFDPQRYRLGGVELIIRRFRDLEYQPRGYDFVPTLSIIDVMMWLPLSEIRAHLDRQRQLFEESRHG